MKHSRGEAGQGKPQFSQASACGKVIVVGEHAAVYGAPAIAIPLGSTRMQASLLPSRDSGAPLQIYLGGRPAPKALFPLISKAFALLELEPFSAVIRGQSQIRAGAGLGSSAALCVVLLRLLCSSVGRELDSATLATLANELEKHFHGTPSGLDTSVVAFERVICFQKHEPAAPNSFRLLSAKPLTVSGEPSPWRFALIDSLEHSPTFQMIEKVRPKFQGEAGKKRVRTFARLAAQVEQGFATGDGAEVAAAMNHASSLLASCGVVTPTMAQIIAEAAQIGVLAAKPTGAGGGGNILVLLAVEHGGAQLEALNRRFRGHPVVAVNLS